jgi:hypothetical protein
MNLITSSFVAFTSIAMSASKYYAIVPVLLDVAKNSVCVACDVVCLIVIMVHLNTKKYSKAEKFSKSQSESLYNGSVTVTTVQQTVIMVYQIVITF